MTEAAGIRPSGVTLDDESAMVLARELTRTFGHGGMAVHAVRGVRGVDVVDGLTNRVIADWKPERGSA